MLLTDVIDKDASSMLLAYTARFARYHLPLCVTMRNLQVEGMAAAEPATVAECYSKAVALRILARRADALGRMRQSGVDVLDVRSSAVDAATAEPVLAAKAAESAVGDQIA